MKQRQWRLTCSEESGGKYQQCLYCSPQVSCGTTDDFQQSLAPYGGEKKMEQEYIHFILEQNRENKALFYLLSSGFLHFQFDSCKTVAEQTHLSSEKQF